MTKGYVGWLLPQQERQRLLKIFPPLFARTIAHHVTLAVGVSDQYPLPKPTAGIIVGEAVDPSGVQALVVSIGGTVNRPGGGIYHITWSLAEGRKPVESNSVIQQLGYNAVDAQPIDLVPQFFPYKLG